MSLKSACIAYWKLDTSEAAGTLVTDQTGNGFHLSGNSVSFDPAVGPSGTAMAIYNGTTKRHLVPELAFMLTGHKATLNYWIKVDDADAIGLKNGSTYFSSAGNPNNFPYHGDDVTIYESFGCLVRKTVGVIAGLNFQNLNMITITVDEALNEFKYYVNGELKYQTTAGLWDWVVTQTLGCSAGTTFLKGRMNHCSLFNKALTAVQIGGLFAGGAGDFYPFSSSVADKKPKLLKNKKSMIIYTEQQILSIVHQAYGKKPTLITPHSFIKNAAVNTTTEDLKYAFFGKVVVTPLGNSGTFGFSLRKSGSLNNGTCFFGEIPALYADGTTGFADLENQLFNKFTQDAIPSGSNLYFIGYKIQFD